MMMNKINQNNSEQLNDSLWSSVSTLVDDLQEYVDRPGKYKITKSRDLLEKLLMAETLPGIDKDELSIVYCEYGSQNYELIIPKENESESNFSNNPGFDAENYHIKKIITKHLNESEYPWFKTAEKCSAEGFPNYGTVMIVPMRLSKNRNIGAFVIHSFNEGAYSEAFRRVMDVLSDRLASLIRSLRRLFRDQITYELRDYLLKRIAVKGVKRGGVLPIQGEFDILQYLRQNLKLMMK